MKVFVYLVFILLHSNLYPQDNRLLKKQVLEHIVNNIESDSESIFLQYGGNEYLRDFLIQNKIPQNQDISFHNFRRCLTEDEIYSILNEAQVDNFLKQISISRKEIIYSLDFINPKITYSPIDEVKSNFKIGCQLNTGIYNLILSEPVISIDNKHILVNYTEGFHNAYSGGILLFEVNQNSIARKCIIDGWIE